MAHTSACSLLSIVLLSVVISFGDQLYPYLRKLIEIMAGSMPSSTLQVLLFSAGCYFEIIFWLRQLIGRRAKTHLRFFVSLYCMILSISSVMLLVPYAWYILSRINEDSITFPPCDQGHDLVIRFFGLFSTDYLIKHMVLLDVVFLVLRKRPLVLLHSYHLGATALLCYSNLVDETLVSWDVVTLNLLVHVIICIHYCRFSRGSCARWRQRMAWSRIPQSIVDMIFIYFAAYTCITSTYISWPPELGKCAGETVATVSALAVLSKYGLYFFALAYITYRDPNDFFHPDRIVENTRQEHAPPALDVEAEAAEPATEHTTGSRTHPHMPGPPPRSSTADVLARKERIEARRLRELIALNLPRQKARSEETATASSDDDYVFVEAAGEY